MTVSWPRLLLLSAESPHSAAAGAIVFLRLLQDYPPDRLLVVTNHLPPAGSTRLGCRYESLPLWADRLNRTRFWSWRAAGRALGGPDWLDLGRVSACLRGFRPEIVLTLMQDSWYYDLAAAYARKHALPLGLFVHDLPDGFEPVPPRLRRRQHGRDARVYRQAVRRFCISDPMRRHFLDEYGADGEVLLPPRAPSPVSRAPEHCAQLKQPERLTLGYAGGLHYGYGEQLLRMLPALRATGTRVEMFGPRPSGAVAALGDATDVFRFNGHAPEPETAWQRLAATCDAILQPYLDPPGPHARQYRTHFPSKLGDALSLGLPLLVTGPADASGVAWCRAHRDCALAAASTDPALSAALCRLRDEPALRLDLARRAQAAATEFSVEALRGQLHHALRSLSLP